MKIKSILALSLLLLLAACSGGYNVDSYVGDYIDSDPQHRIITIEGFKGTMERSMSFEETSLVSVDIVGDSPFQMTLISPNEDVIFEYEFVGDPISGVFEGSFPTGDYTIIFESRKLDSAEIKLNFNE